MLRRLSIPADYDFGRLCLLALAACSTPSEGPNDFAPDAPIVLETTPRDGDDDVHASLAAITATFSEAMDLAGWSWVTEVGRSAPSITGLPFYLDETTTVLPVRLEPGQTYGIWLNSPDDADLRNFANPGGVPARAHRIHFSTRLAE